MEKPEREVPRKQEKDKFFGGNRPIALQLCVWEGVGSRLGQKARGYCVRKGRNRVARVQLLLHSHHCLVCLQHRRYRILVQVFVGGSSWLRIWRLVEPQYMAQLLTFEALWGGEKQMSYNGNQR